MLFFTVICMFPLLPFLCRMLKWDHLNELSATGVRLNNSASVSSSFFSFVSFVSQ